MINQLKVENYKFLRSIFFWIAMLFMAAVGIYNGFKWDVSAHATEIMTSFDQALPDMSFVFMPALFTAWFIGSNFSTRTIHHEITSGASRFSVILSRSLPAIISGVLLHAAFIVTTVVSLGGRIGFDTFILSSDHVLWIVTVLLQMIALESFFIFIGFLSCNLYIGLISSVISAFTFVNVFRNIFRNASWYQFSFFHFWENNSSADLITCSIVAVVSIVVFSALSYIVFRKREI